MKNRIVVYTSIFGEYDGLLPQKRIKGLDYVCFSDSDPKATPWEVRKIAASSVDPVRCAKEHKILPHRFFPDYEISIWIDGNFLVERDPGPLIEAALSDKNMAMFNHNRTLGDSRDCIYDEFKSIVRLSEDAGKAIGDPEVMKKQIERYRKEGYPEHNGLINGGVLLRRHHADDVKRTMERWWEEICQGSRRDQLSFNYAAWKEGTLYTLIDDNIRDNRWFYMIGIHRSDYRMKLFRYKLKRLFGLKRHH